MREAFGNRVADVAKESQQFLNPIVGLEHVPLTSFENSMKYLSDIVPFLDSYAFTSISWAESMTEIPFGISVDEAAALNIYVREWTKKEDSFYYIFNSKLRSENRDTIKPFFAYMRLFLSALEKIPKYKDLPTVWRGVNSDLSKDYPKGKKFPWWGCSSCTTDMDALGCFLGTNGFRTLFNIHVENAFDIALFSVFPKEKEVLLPPARYFEVINNFNAGNGLTIIELKEILPRAPLIHFVPKISINPITLDLEIILTQMPYDNSWPSLYETMVEKIVFQFKTQNISPPWTFDHIGSTSIPGLSAKPYIDIMVQYKGVEKLDDFREKVNSALVKLSFNRAGSTWWIKQPESGKDMGYIVHVASDTIYKRAVKFREKLKNSHDVRQKYQELKKDLETKKITFADYCCKKSFFFNGIFEIGEIESQLKNAILTKNIDEVLKILKNPLVNVNSINWEYDLSPLAIALYVGDDCIINALLDHGASPYVLCTGRCNRYDLPEDTPEIKRKREELLNELLLKFRSRMHPGVRSIPLASGFIVSPLIYISSESQLKSLLSDPNHPFIIIQFIGSEHDELSFGLFRVQYEMITFVVVDGSKLRNIEKQYSVSAPAFIFLENGRIIEKLVDSTNIREGIEVFKKWDKMASTMQHVYDV